MKNFIILTDLELKKIFSGHAQSLDDQISAASCTKDCGNNKSVTCDGPSCATTDYGCYDGVNGGPNHKYCSQA